MASQLKKTFAKFGSKIFLVITLKTELIFLKLILWSANTVSNFPKPSAILALHVPVSSSIPPLEKTKWQILYFSIVVVI